MRTCPRNIWTLQLNPNIIEIKARHFAGKSETVKSWKFQHEEILSKRQYCLILKQNTMYAYFSHGDLLKFQTVLNTLAACQLVRTELLAISNSICEVNRLDIEI